MRNQKRYTTQTFTHRVDHDGGRHRGPRAAREPVVCPGCGSFYRHRRWLGEGQKGRSEPNGSGGPLVTRLCPACRRRRSGLPRGFVHIDGSFVSRHRAEIESLLHRDAAHAYQDNPLGQVLQWGEDGTGGLLVTTTTEHLAIRLGRTLERTYDGQLLFGFAHENKLAHIWWHRDK